MGVKMGMWSQSLLNPSVHQSSITPLQFYNPTIRLNSGDGISKFANLKSLFPLWAVQVSLSWRAVETFLLKLVLVDSGSMQTCGPVWKRMKSWSVIPRYDVCIQIQKIERQKSPLLLFTVPQCWGRKIGSPGSWLLEPDRRAGLAVYLQKKYFCSSRGSDLCSAWDSVKR